MKLVGGRAKLEGGEVNVYNMQGVRVSTAPIGAFVDGKVLPYDYTVSPDGTSFSWTGRLAPTGTPSGGFLPAVLPDDSPFGSLGTISNPKNYALKMPNACMVAAGVGGVIAGAPWAAAAVVAGTGPVGLVMAAATGGIFWLAGTQC